MLIRLVTFSTFLLCFFKGNSQTDTIVPFKYGFTYESSERFCNIRNLNSSLKDASFAEIENKFRGISFGWTTREKNNNSYTTIHFTWLASEPNNVASNNKARIDVFELACNYHGVFSKSAKWLLYPYVGIGLNLGRLRLTETNSFYENISNPTNQQVYFNDFPVISGNIGVGVDRKISIFKLDYYLGLNFGYAISTKEGWGFEQTPLTSYSGFEYKIKVRVEINKRSTK